MTGKNRSRNWLACVLLLPALSTLAANDEVNELELAPAPIRPDVVNELEAAPEAGTEPAVVSYPEPDDPLERFNRSMFAFNHGLYTRVLIPSAKGYRRVVPAPARTRIGMVFGNLQEPLNSLSHLFRGHFDEAGGSFVRFVTNSTVGVLGLFDPAAHWLGIETQPSRLDQALADAQVPRGPYLVLPLLGPGDLRGSGASIGEALLHPLNFLLPSPESVYTQSAGRFQAFAPEAETYETLYGTSEDPYRYFRNQYVQRALRDEDHDAE